jgi:hypothetical protein
MLYATPLTDNMAANVLLLGGHTKEQPTVKLPSIQSILIQSNPTQACIAHFR